MADDLTERRVGIAELSDRLNDHNDRLVRVEESTIHLHETMISGFERIEKSINKLTDKLAVTREEASESRARLAIIWAAFITGAGGLGTAIWTRLSGH